MGHRNKGARRRGGRGGSVPSGRIFSNKKKSKGTSNNHRPALPTSIDVPELMDLEGNVYIPKDLLSSMSRRPGRLRDEVGYTQQHISETMSRALRNNPIKFVKAAHVYDPNESLRKIKEEKVRKEESILVNNNSMDENDSEDLTIDSDSVTEQEKDTPYLEVDEDANIGHPNISDFENNEDLDVVDVEEEISVKNLTIAETETKNVEPLPLSIDARQDNSVLKKHNVRKLLPRVLIDQVIQDETSNIDHDNELTIGKVSLRPYTDSKGQAVVDLPLLGKDMVREILQENVNHDYVFSEGEEEEEEGEDIYDYNVDGPMQPLDLLNVVLDDGKPETESDCEELKNANENDSEEEDTEEDTDDSEDEDVNESEDDPEYGFLEEDYEFDVSQIKVMNVRFGIQNQYYASNNDLTGSMDQFSWVDEDELVDYVLLKGVKEHRLNSFLKFITGGLIEDEVEEHPNYSDVYISDSSEEEQFESSNEDDEDDGDLEALIAYSKSLQNFLSLDNPTELIRTKGSGRKKGLDLDGYDIEDDIRESLLEQYQAHRLNQKSKKNKKQQDKMEQALITRDLTTLYPFSLHIKDFRKEFELFLHDGGRDTLSFPPLDPHGNKTVAKMAKCYNMKSKKCGNNGLKQYMKVSKSRSTFHYLPQYDQINHMTKQRPIFHRSDRKRLQEEIDETDGKKDKRRGKSTRPAFKEGDIVGASAPEISKDNIGRQLLEKLGWVKGEGLGAHGNKGISEPVMAKMKKSKEGLK